MPVFSLHESTSKEQTIALQKHPSVWLSSLPTVHVQRQKLALVIVSAKRRNIYRGHPSIPEGIGRFWGHFPSGRDASGRNDDHAFVRDPVNYGRNDDQGRKIYSAVLVNIHKWLSIFAEHPIFDLREFA